MGRTNQPLTIAVTDASLLDHPALGALREKGHNVILVEGQDLTIGPRAWFMDEEHLDRYLDLALKMARARKRTKDA